MSSLESMHVCVYVKFTSSDAVTSIWPALFLFLQPTSIYCANKSTVSSYAQLPRNAQSTLAKERSPMRMIIDYKLSLHLGNTESILFGSPQKIKCNPSLEITCNKLAIKSTRTVNHFKMCHITSNFVFQWNDSIIAK